MSRRATIRRGIKKRGVLPSFGDMVLPIVGVAAVVLLVIAGRQFFLNGLKSSPGISSTRAYAEAPAVVAEHNDEKQNILPVVKAEASNDIKLSAPSIRPTTAGGQDRSTTADKIEESEIKPETQNDFLAVAVPRPRLTGQTKATVTPQQKTAKTSTPKSTSNATVKKTPQASTSASASSAQQWRVQVGAYTSKSGAQEAAKKINKAGYKATVYQNPASKHVKVWVQGGADKKSAEKVAAAMVKLGFKGSFAFPPAK